MLLWREKFSPEEVKENWKPKQEWTPSLVKKRLKERFS